MSRLSRFMAKPVEVDFDGEKLMIWPLTLQNIDLMVGASNPAQQAASIRKMVELTLKKAVPDATDEELENFSVEHFEKLFNAIQEVNKLAVKDGATSKVREFIEQKKRIQSGERNEERRKKREKKIMGETVQKNILIDLIDNVSPKLLRLTNVINKSFLPMQQQTDRVSKALQRMNAPLSITEAVSRIGRASCRERV